LVADFAAMALFEQMNETSAVLVVERRDAETASARP
jgi:hypothetical protein